MCTRDESPHFHERYCSRLPIKIPQTKYKDGGRHHYFTGRMYDVSCGEDRTNLGSISDLHCHAKLKDGLTDKSTQMSIKNFYDSYILEGLLNTHSDISTSRCNVNNANDVSYELDPLSDIKNILLTTNDKLDMILNRLADKKEHLINLCKDPAGKQTKSKLKPRTKPDGLKSMSHLSLPITKHEDVTLGCPWAKCVSSTCITRLRPNHFYISPYFPPYYVKPISHYNYFKIFGPKYSDPNMADNVWSPFMLMATSFNVRKLQNGISAERIGHCLDNQSLTSFDEEESPTSIEYTQNVDSRVLSSNNPSQIL